MVRHIARPFKADPRRQIAIVEPAFDKGDPFVAVHDFAFEAAVCDGVALCIGHRVLGHDGERAILSRQFHQPIGNARLNVKVALLVDAVDLRQFRNRGAGDEVRQRNEARRGAHLEVIKGGQNAVFFGEADADFDLFVRAIHPHRVE